MRGNRGVMGEEKVGGMGFTACRDTLLDFKVLHLDVKISRSKRDTNNGGSSTGGAGKYHSQYLVRHQDSLQLNDKNFLGYILCEKSQNAICTIYWGYQILLCNVQAEGPS